MTVPVAPEDFDTALGVLREMGWTQGRSNGPGGAVCLARALNLAYGARTGGRHIRIDGPYESTWMNVARLMGIPASINGVVEWNDLNSTTLEKVEQHLARAAQKLRQELAIGPTS